MLLIRVSNVNSIQIQLVFNDQFIVCVVEGEGFYEG